MSDAFKLVGQTLEGPVQIEAVVGEGGFGVVYRGQHATFGEPVAVKVLKLPASLDATQRETFLKKFRLEARILYKLSKTTLNVVRPIHFGSTETPAGFAPYCVMEWLDGQTLDALIRARHAAITRGELAGGRSIAELAPLVDPLVVALDCAHALGVVHRDIKPPNVFLVAGDPSRPSVSGASVKLLDFGIAKLLDLSGDVAGAAGPTTTLSSGTLMALTPEYAAPEQWDRDLGDFGPATDIYALAMMVLEMMADRHPQAGMTASQRMFAACNPNKRPTPRALGMNVSDAVEQAFATAVAVSPSERAASAGQWWAAVKAAAGVGAAVGSAAVAVPATVVPAGALAGSAAAAAGPTQPPPGHAADVARSATAIAPSGVAHAATAPQNPATAATMAAPQAPGATGPPTERSAAAAVAAAAAPPGPTGPPTRGAAGAGPSAWTPGAAAGDQGAVIPPTAGSAGAPPAGGMGAAGVGVVGQGAPRRKGGGWAWRVWALVGTLVVGGLVAAVIFAMPRGAPEPRYGSASASAGSGQAVANAGSGQAVANAGSGQAAGSGQGIAANVGSGSAAVAANAGSGSAAVAANVGRSADVAAKAQAQARARARAAALARARARELGQRRARARALALARARAVTKRREREGQRLLKRARHYYRYRKYGAAYSLAARAARHLRGKSRVIALVLQGIAGCASGRTRWASTTSDLLRLERRVPLARPLRLRMQRECNKLWRQRRNAQRSALRRALRRRYAPRRRVPSRRTYRRSSGAEPAAKPAAPAPAAKPAPAGH